MPIPTPEPGLVISYAYLWHHERLAGADEGRKDRPAVVMLVTTRQGGDAIEVTVLPITHRPPDNPEWAVEIPPPVKRHLGLDEARSWVVVAEGNDFLWPGYDLRRAPGADRYDYGFLPPRFFNQVPAAFGRLRAAGNTAVLRANDRGNMSGTAVTLHCNDPARNTYRYYRLDAQPDLFGYWCCVREWGRIGAAGQTRSVP